MKLDRGYLSPYFITNMQKMEVMLENSFVLLFDKKLSMLKDLLPVLEKVSTSNSPLLIIAEDVDGAAISTLVINKLGGSLKIAAIKAPGFGERRKELLEDIAVLVAGTVISEETGHKLENITLEMLGNVEKIVITKDTTTLINGRGTKENINLRIEQLKKQIKLNTSAYDKKKIHERLAKLTGGVAVLYVGAATEVELKEKKDRVDDALSATKAAMEEGIVPGGGVAYVRAVKAIEALKGENEDQNIGIAIIRKALEEPFRQIVRNAGLSGSVILEKVKEGKSDFGFNAQNGQYENLYQSGIIDPTKVIRIALENAASIAGMMLTTESLIFERKQNRNEIGFIQ
jgi:chaperonin GroEL